MPHITVEVEVDIDEFDDDDIRREFIKRKLSDLEITVEIDEIFYALKLGKNDIVMELVRKFVCNATGRVL